MKITMIFSLHSRPNTEMKGDQFTAYYTVHGAQVGHTTLTAEARPRLADVVRSIPKPVEVCRII